MRTRLKGEQGFGLLELLMAIAMLNIGVLALVAAFSSGTVAIKRASKVSTASALADSQMELYRALTYAAVALDSGSVTAANSDSTYSGDSAWNASQITATCTTPLPAQCLPKQSVTGADGHSYRVDTFIVQQTPTGGRPLKLVTVVVRDGLTLATTWAREASTFDASTG